MAEIGDHAGYLITWTTYGTWLPGDSRGWRKRGRGEQEPDERLESWCRDEMRADHVMLGPSHREAVEAACREHCDLRGWDLLAINARSNHVHVVVVAGVSPQTVRDQLKANCTRTLRRSTDPLIVERTWTKGGDCQLLADDEALTDAMAYVLEGQDRREEQD